MRSVPEWIADNDDQRVPDRVRLRVFLRFDGRCQCGCNRAIRPGERWRLDHKTALILGGEHREKNFQPILEEHDKAKVRKEVAEKSRTYQRRSRHIGIRKSKQLIPGSKGTPYRKRVDGRVERRSAQSAYPTKGMEP